MLPVIAVALLLTAGTAVAWATGALPRIPVVGAVFSSTRITRRPPAVETVAARVRPRELAPPTEKAPANELDRVLDRVDETEIAQARRGEDHPASLRSSSRGHTSHPTAPLAVRREPAAPEEASAGLGPTPTTDGNPIVREGESFAKALRSWRRAHDAKAALSALDAHDRAFSTGQMTLESRLLRVEILLSAGRDREALALLDRLPLAQGNVPRGRELLTVRGELRIKAGRCADGRADLASTGAGSDTFAERARNALTHCR
ncbi:MAG TPA: hypothetical protein VIU64_04325 [Polyangia bacterium]